jgi:hypothetical protein
MNVLCSFPSSLCEWEMSLMGLLFIITTPFLSFPFELVLQTSLSFSQHAQNQLIIWHFRWYTFRVELSHPFPSFDGPCFTPWQTDANPDYTNAHTPFPLRQDNDNVTYLKPSPVTIHGGVWWHLVIELSLSLVSASFCTSTWKHPALWQLAWSFSDFVQLHHSMNVSQNNLPW